MSAGSFEYHFYETDAGDIARIRVQPETLALDIGGATNASAAGPATIPGTARVSGSKRSFGVVARSISVSFTGAAPAGYSGDAISRIPILQAANYTAINLGDTGTYLGAAVEVIGKSAESIR